MKRRPALSLVVVVPLLALAVGDAGLAVGVLDGSEVLSHPSSAPAPVLKWSRPGDAGAEQSLLGDVTASSSESPGGEADGGVGGSDPSGPGSSGSSVPPRSGSSHIYDWPAADLAEIKRAVDAFRATRGLTPFAVPLYNCDDRGLAATAVRIGPSNGETLAQNLIRNGASSLASTARRGGFMAASFWAADLSDPDGVVHPRATVLVRVYECSDIYSFARANQNQFPPSPGWAPVPPPVPTPTPEPSTPAPSDPPVEPSPSPAD